MERTMTNFNHTEVHRLRLSFSLISQISLIFLLSSFRFSQAYYRKLAVGKHVRLQLKNMHPEVFKHDLKYQSQCQISDFNK